MYTRQGPRRFTIEGAKRLINEKKRTALAYKIEADKKRAIEEKRSSVNKKKRIAEEKKRIEKEKKRIIAEEEKRIEKEKKRIEKEKKRIIAEEEKRIEKEKKRIIAEEKKRIEKEKKRIIAEEKKRIEKEKKRIIAEEKKQIEKEKKRIIAEEKKRIEKEKKRANIDEKKRKLNKTRKMDNAVRRRVSVNATKHERDFVSDINSKFTGPATFIFEDSNGNKSKEIKNVMRFRQLQGSIAKSPEAYVDREYNKPKADIAAVDINGKDVAWISHKATIGFQQYLKISGKKLKFTGKELEEVLEFKRKVVSLAPVSKIWPVGKTIWSPIKSDLIKNQAIFGFDYGKKLGRDNVDIIGQGSPIIKKENSILYLTFSGFSALNGHLENFTGKHQPIFYVRSERSSSGRGITAVVDGITYKNLRFFIHPYNFVSAKTVRV